MQPDEPRPIADSGAGDPINWADVDIMTQAVEDPTTLPEERIGDFAPDELAQAASDDQGGQD